MLKKSSVCKHTRPATMPVNVTHIELQPISNPMVTFQTKLSPQIIQEVLKASGVDISNFEQYNWHKVLHQSSAQATELY